MAEEPRQADILEDVQELASELETFRQIVETASDAVVTINAQHEVVFMNAAAERMFGYQRREILGGDLLPLIPHELRDHHRGYVERYIRTRQARMIGRTAEMTGERRDGSRFPVSISFSVAEINGRLLFTAILRDLSAQRNLEEQVKRAERLAAVGQMVATVGHEIRTPLMLIGGFARQLQKEAHLGPAARRKVDIIAEEAQRLEGMLNDLKDLSRPQRYEWAELDLGEVVGHVRELMAPEFDKQGLRLAVDIAPGLPPVVGDRNRLSQVLINLLQNALHASPEGAAVEVEVAPTGLGGVLARIRDHGQGIAPEDLERVFEPFFTTKKRGTGLGLPVAKRIVTEHGGRLRIKSTPGQGTTVTMDLPPKPGAPGDRVPPAGQGGAGEALA
jgi:PAS domain S-box-containing protein